MLNHSYENEFNLHVNEISFSYEKMGTKTRFEEEAKGNSEMAYFVIFLPLSNVTSLSVQILQTLVVLTGCFTGADDSQWGDHALQ